MEVGIIFISVLVWGLFHSFFASLSAKAIATRWLGGKAMRFYRLGYNLFASLSFLPIIWLLLTIPDRVIFFLPVPWLFPLIIGQLGALLVMFIGLRQRGALNLSGIRQALLEAEESSELDTTGLYRTMRHPLYTAGLAFIWLMPVMTLNSLVFNLALTIYIFIGAYFEERKLVVQFGQAYRDYQAGTPMLIPFLKGNKHLKRPS
jgi:protein-S-isoprenylcysteine O-methyltransferase Ste14